MKKLHLICNSHIDTIWQWEWGEGMSSALSTFQSAANLMKKHDYIFCHNESSLYKYTEKYAPELFEEIQVLIKEGAWHVMGGWYLQPDCLMSKGESFIRQIREGQLFFEEKFGKWIMPKTAICFDAFGHSRGLVQIVKKCGQENYVFMRPYSKHVRPERPQIDLPAECFLWEGYDGSTIKALHGTEYNSALGHAVEKITADMEKLKEEEIAASLWGVGNHGGGPSDKDLTDIEKLMTESDVEIVHSTPDAFFAEVNPTAVWDKSLLSCMPGCYTSMMGIKQKFREFERQLYLVEKMLSIAELKGVYPYPMAQMKEVVEDLLNVQFHDVLPGTCIKEGEDNAFRYINHGLKELEQLKLDCFFALCRGQRVAEENTYPILVFNPKPYFDEQYVECELSIIPTDYFESEYSQLEIYDEQGTKLLAQTIKEGSNISIDWRKKVIFKAKLNPLGITRFTAKTVVLPKPSYPYGQDVIFENDCKKIVVSAKTGLIESYVVDGKEYANGSLFALHSYDDTADPWAMSNEETFEGIGNNPQAFTLLQEGDGVFKGLHSLEVIEDGEIYLAAEAFFASGLTRARIGYKIYKEGELIDIDIDLFPAEMNKCIKVHIPMKAERFVGEQVFGTEELFMNGRECIAHNFIALQNGDKYLEVLTPDSFASSYKDDVAKITLLRNVTYCAHPVPNRPLVLENIFLPKVDQGQKSYRFRLMPSKEESLQKNADIFQEKPYALNIFPTIDKKVDNGYEIKTNNPEIAVVTIFKAQQADGYVIRLQNNSSKQAETTLTLGDRSILLHFNKYEVKTVLHSKQKTEEISEFII